MRLATGRAQGRPFLGPHARARNLSPRAPHAMVHPLPSLSAPSPAVMLRFVIVKLTDTSISVCGGAGAAAARQNGTP